MGEGRQGQTTPAQVQAAGSWGEDLGVFGAWTLGLGSRSMLQVAWFRVQWTLGLGRCGLVSARLEAGAVPGTWILLLGTWGWWLVRGSCYWDLGAWILLLGPWV